MNLRKTILAEHSKSQANKIVKWIGDDKKRFDGLVYLFLNDEYRVVQRAAWPLSDIAILHPHLVKPYIGKFVKLLSARDKHPAVGRNILRMFQFIDIPTKYHGELVNACFDFLIKNEYPIAFKAFSMKVLANITKKEPGLKRELKLVIGELMKEGSPGIKARGRKVLAELEKIS